MWDYTFEQLIECHSVKLLSAKSQHQLTGLCLLPFLPSPLSYFLPSSRLASAHNRLLLARFTQGLQVLNRIKSCPIIQKIHFSPSCSWALPRAIKPCLLASYHTGITVPQLLTAPHFLSQLKKRTTLLVVLCFSTLHKAVMESLGWESACTQICSTLYTHRSHLLLSWQTSSF